MRTQSETERKYEAGSVGEFPALDSLAGIEVRGVDTQVLEAVYFDTPGLRLSRAGITMRSRTGGDDSGWHLKVPAGGDTRDEMLMPLDAGAPDAPPERFLALTTGYTRGDEVGAVATVTTTRLRRELLDDSGTVLAYVTDDRVEATALRSDATGPTGVGPTSAWREVEVELTAGTDPVLLDEVDEQLRRHGVLRAQHDSKLSRVLDVDRVVPRHVDRAATAGDAVLGYLEAQIARLLNCDLRTRRNDEDAVHQMRVATRRLRSVLRVYGRVLDRAQTRRVADELKWLGQRLGPARDLEVMYAHERAELDRLPTELVVGPVAARLSRHFSRAETDARHGVERTLASRRYLRLLDSLERVIAYPPLTDRAHRPAAEELPKHVRRAHRKVARRVATVDDTTQPAARDGALHSARKAAKRLRYGCEVAVPVVGKTADKTRKGAKAMAKVLGEHQDAVLARELLRDLGMRAFMAGENGFTFGLLYGRETTRARDSEHTFSNDVWKRVAAKRHRRWFE